jgi:hypothetical protein
MMSSRQSDELIALASVNSTTTSVAVSTSDRNSDWPSRPVVSTTPSNSGPSTRPSAVNSIVPVTGEWPRRFDATANSSSATATIAGVYADIAATLQRHEPMFVGLLIFGSARTTMCSARSTPLRRNERQHLAPRS